MELFVTLPNNFQTKTVRELLEDEWLIPRKVRHFLRTRRNVLVNNEPTLFHLPVKAHDVVTLIFEEEDYPKPTVLLGDRKQVNVLFEDEQLIILNKPVGMKTHPNQPDETDSLLNHLADYLTDQKKIPYVVHRLDKETSGAILFAKNPVILPVLGRMLEKRQLHRRYQAIVTGAILKENWTINQKIGRDRHDRRKRVIDNRNGDLAITHVEVAATLSNPKRTCLYCVLETGRTHQIRVHLASEGYPLIGDPLYNPKPTGRLMLHALELNLVHPFTKETISVTAAPGIWT